MKKKVFIIVLAFILVLSGCSKEIEEKTNYIAPVALSESEQELMNLVAPNPNEYILCEFDASDYKEMSVLIEKYKYGELVESSGTGAIISETSLGKGKLYMEFHEDEFDLAISSMGKMSCSTPIDVDIESVMTLYTAFDEKISLTDKDKILFYKAYGDENATDMNGYNTEDLMRDGNIDEFPLCYVVKLVVK